MNTQITEDYVSFETAKLLKEKGFDSNTYAYYEDEDNPNISLHASKAINWNKTEFISKPTLQTARKWFRKVHNLEMGLSFGFPLINGKQQFKYFWFVVRICNDHLEYPMDNPETAEFTEKCVDTYQEACNDFIKYCCMNLI
jgi:hypothetical protein